MIVLALLAIAGAIYSAIALVAARRYAARTMPSATARPRISVLKPIHGLEAELFENLSSFCNQEYPSLQVLFGVQAADDAAIPVIRRVIEAFPQHDLELVVDGTPHAGNPKVANLTNMLPRATGEIIVIADADMRVDRSYLDTIAASFDDPRTGAVTCLYAGEPRDGLASQLAALQLNDQFAPSVLVATLGGDPAFCFGSTMAIRRGVLDSIGGIAVLAPTIADDYMLGKLVSEQGHRVALSRYVVRNIVHEPNLRAMLTHELRWARTIRSVRPAGYLSTIVTFPFPFALAWALLAPASSYAWTTLAVVLALRFVTHAVMSDVFALRDGWRFDIYLLPLRDCLGLGVWAAGLFGNTVRWKEQTLKTK